MHVHAALRARLRVVLPTPTEADLKRPGHTFARAGSLADVAQPLRFLDEAVERLGVGEVDLGLVVPLAQALVPLARELVFHPPADELRSTGAEHA